MFWRPPIGTSERDFPIPEPVFARLIPTWYHVAVAMTLRLNEEQERALALLAEADGVSKQEATVRAIMDAASRRIRDDRVRELSDSARERYAPLLQRLAQ